MWESAVIRLRAVRPEDGDLHLVWNRDSAMMRGLDRLYLPQTEAAARQWAEEEAAKGNTTGDNFHFEIETLGGELVGSISTHGCDLRTGTFSYGVAVRSEHQRKGYAAEAIRLVLRFYFGELRYQKVTVDVYEFNDASRQLHERLGFMREGCVRRMVYTDGRFWDKLLYGLTVEEFQAQIEDRANMIQQIEKSA